MKLTKYEHACLVLSVASDRLIIDPGEWLSPPDFTDIVAVVVTHEHKDHWTSANLERILEASPGARIFAPAGVAARAQGFDVEIVAHGDHVEIAGFSLDFFGEKHAIIHSTVPVIDNVGVLVNNELYYAGDSYTVPEAPVGTLAAPIGAPWLKISEAMEYVLAVKAARVFYTHDMTLSVIGRGESGPRLEWATTQVGGEWIPLGVGDSLDI